MAQVSTAKRALFCKSTSCKTFRHFKCTVNLTDRRLANFPCSSKKICCSACFQYEIAKKQFTWVDLHNGPKSHWSSTSRMINHWLHNHVFSWEKHGDFYNSSGKIVSNLAINMFPQKASKLSKSGQCDSHHCTREGQEWLVRELCHTYLSSGARLHVSKGYRQSGRLTTWTCCCWWFDGDIRWWCIAAYPTPPCGSQFHDLMLNHVAGRGLFQTSSLTFEKTREKPWSEHDHIDGIFRIPIRGFPLKWSIPTLPGKGGGGLQGWQGCLEVLNMWQGYSTPNKKCH